MYGEFSRLDAIKYCKSDNVYDFACLFISPLNVFCLTFSFLCPRGVSSIREDIDANGVVPQMYWGTREGNVVDAKKVGIR